MSQRLCLDFVDSLVKKILFFFPADIVVTSAPRANKGVRLANSALILKKNIRKNPDEGFEFMMVTTDELALRPIFIVQQTNRHKWYCSRPVQSNGARFPLQKAEIEVRQNTALSIFVIHKIGKTGITVFNVIFPEKGMTYNSQP